MARRTILISDLSQAEIPDGRGAKVTIKFADARKRPIVLDVTEAEADELGRRGRNPLRRRKRTTSEPGRAVEMPLIDQRVLRRARSGAAPKDHLAVGHRHRTDARKAVVNRLGALGDFRARVAAALEHLVLARAVRSMGAEGD